MNSTLQTLTNTLHQAQAIIAALQGSFVTETVLMVGVGHPYAKIEDAWAAIQNKICLTPVTIQVDCTTPTVIMQDNIVFGPHPSAGLISILGNLANPSNCRLVQRSVGTPPALFTWGSGQNGMTFGGFKLVSATTDYTFDNFGIYVTAGAILHIANSPQCVVLQDFDKGCVAELGGQLHAPSGVSVVSGSIGISAFGGFISVANFTANTSYQSVQAFVAGTVIMGGGTVSSTSGTCIAAGQDSKIEDTGSTTLSGCYIGISASYGSSISSGTLTITGTGAPGSVGVISSGFSIVYAVGAVANNFASACSCSANSSAFIGSSFCCNG